MHEKLEPSLRPIKEGMPRAGNMSVHFARCTCTEHVEEEEENSAHQTIHCLERCASQCINSLAIRRNHGSHFSRASGLNVILNNITYEVLDVPHNIFVNSSRKKANNSYMQKRIGPFVPMEDGPQGLMDRAHLPLEIQGRILELESEIRRV